MFAVFTKCKNKSEISGLNQGVCVQIREIFRESLEFQIPFADFWREAFGRIITTHKPLTEELRCGFGLQIMKYGYITLAFSAEDRFFSNRLGALFSWLSLF